MLCKVTHCTGYVLDLFSYSEVTGRLRLLSNAYLQTVCCCVFTTFTIWWLFFTVKLGHVCYIVCVLLLPHKDEEILQKEGNALPPAWEAGRWWGWGDYGDSASRCNNSSATGPICHIGMTTSTLWALCHSCWKQYIYRASLTMIRVHVHT